MHTKPPALVHSLTVLLASVAASLNQFKSLRFPLSWMPRPAAQLGCHVHFSSPAAAGYPGGFIPEMKLPEDRTDRERSIIGVRRSDIDPQLELPISRSHRRGGDELDIYRCPAICHLVHSIRGRRWGGAVWVPRVDRDVYDFSWLSVELAGRWFRDLYAFVILISFS
jgi:hypothetical protein